ncbi:helix-turn-helix transcriptional regulator [Pseudomonas aeruginosa]|uniref:helix-turn-helix transcriptional regulator n=1 Tax=Pseudomonas aeruginosa TaxID=287 RepID=UPI000B4D5B32|nr:helix-turn-helix transcriptional regulator [Pseudomonas aeruginosa]ASD20690.1 transcriptional regulator [Pseudomonas aeruginosa]MCG7079553.1 helix-turn-helix domain-containing protein [Pseudomonas aeruginosa]MCG7087315.1 helix-turn-helix domain-containing protein [Pseudomonas aeruginosa]MCG7092847.1 helix-turn-helix domain-containing protein [Pseudomonas aeruginosa]MCG7098905.1 helix-turn-helix domain-containing protein [Pseudomonas aeruginosa]
MKKLQPEERAQLIEEICKCNVVGLDSIGTSIRRLRLEVTGLDQETFAKMCKMSTKSLYELESGKSNPKLSTLEAVLRLFGVRMGLVGISSSLSAARVADQTVGTLKTGGAIAVSAKPLANLSPLAISHKPSGPKRGKKPVATKANK